MSLLVKRSRNSPLELDVLVDEDGDAHGDQGKEDAGHEHDAEAGHPSEDGQRPKQDLYLVRKYFSYQW